METTRYYTTPWKSIWFYLLIISFVIFIIYVIYIEVNGHGDTSTPQSLWIYLWAILGIVLFLVAMGFFLYDMIYYHKKRKQCMKEKGLIHEDPCADPVKHCKEKYYFELKPNCQ